MVAYGEGQVEGGGVGEVFLGVEWNLDSDIVVDTQSGNLKNVFISQVAVILSKYGTLSSQLCQ